MLFGVMADPYIKVYGALYLAQKKLFLNLASLGIGGLEISYATPYEGLEWYSCVENLRDLAEKFSVKISMHAPVGDISSMNEKTRLKAVEKILKAIRDFGEVVGEGIVVVHPEDITPVKPFSSKERRKKCVESLGVLASSVKQLDVKIALENMRWRRDKPRRTGMYLDEIAEIIQGLDEENVGICFDVGHAYVSEGESLYQTFRTNSRRVIHVHLHDNHGYHGDDEHLELGEGTVDLKKFCAVLKEVGYSEAVIFEVTRMKSGDNPLRFYRRNYRKFLDALS